MKRDYDKNFVPKKGKFFLENIIHLFDFVCSVYEKHGGESGSHSDFPHNSVIRRAPVRLLFPFWEMQLFGNGNKYWTQDLEPQFCRKIIPQ